jgi:hypothetical protein
MADLLVARMEDWDFTQGFYYGLSQEAKEHIDNLMEKLSSYSRLKRLKSV